MIPLSPCWVLVEGSRLLSKLALAAFKARSQGGSWAWSEGSTGPAVRLREGLGREKPGLLGRSVPPGSPT